MTPKQLREWLFQNTQNDQWWISLDAVAEDCPVTIAEIEELLKSGQYSDAQALHVSQADLANPPWIEVELPAPPQKIVSSATPPMRKLPAAAPISSPGSINRPINAAGQTHQETLGIILLLLPLVAALLIWFWIGSMNLFQNPGSTLSMLSIGTVVITGILVGVEANQLGIGINTDTDKKGRKKTGPIGWAILTMLVWIVGYPAYLWYRSKYGAKNMVVGGIAVALVFLGVVGLMNTAIEDKKDEVRESIENLQYMFE